MNTSAVGSVDSAASASAVTSGTAKATNQVLAQTAVNPTFEEAFRLAMMSSDTGDISAQAKSLLQEKGVGPALALLGN